MPGWLETSGVVGEWVELGKGDLAAIPADKFGAAATTLIGVFDLISGMGMAKGDMDKNANTVKAAAEANSGKTLQELVDAPLDFIGLIKDLLHSHDLRDVEL